MTRALDRNSSRRWIMLALVPWAISLYAYALAFVVVPIMLGLIAILYRKVIWDNLKMWIVSATIFAIIAFPISLFSRILFSVM